MVGEDEEWLLGALQRVFPTPLMPNSPPGAPGRQRPSSSLQEAISLRCVHMYTISVGYLSVGTGRLPHTHTHI
jgi:hypothetical protein